MHTRYYVGLDVHKKTVSACVKTADGTIVDERTLASRPAVLTEWASSIDAPWTGGMEATLRNKVTGYRFPLPFITSPTQTFRHASSCPCCDS